MGCAQNVVSIAVAVLVAACTNSQSPDDASADATTPDAIARDASTDASAESAFDAIALDAADATVDATPADAVNVDAAPDVPAVTGDASTGWQITVYYTPVEQFHAGAPMQVSGCTTIDCSVGTADLGTYPADFVQLVQDEGTGRISSGAHAGEYLNWSIDVGYWLDRAPRDDRGMPLVPYVSAAADPSVPFDVSFRVTDCGVDDTDGSAIDPTVCAELRAASWAVCDRFTVGAVGTHVDLYIGEEDSVNFADTSPRVISTRDAVLTF